MISSVIVISWWSNCLALACIEKLKLFIPGRKIFVVQVGKQKDSKRKFSELLPPDVQELIYPDDEPCPHWQVIETVVKRILKNTEGLWFFDHDVFLTERATEWMNKMDEVFIHSELCICLPNTHMTQQSITSPAFWISPIRLPEDVPCFSPLPLYHDRIANTPYKLYDFKSDLIRPQYDTLMKAVEILDKLKRVRYFDANYSNLKFSHLGSLYLFAYKYLPEHLREFICETARNFDSFYSSLPFDWVKAEDQSLLNIVRENLNKHQHFDQSGTGCKVNIF